MSKDPLDLILELALQAYADPTGLPVLGDVIQEHKISGDAYMDVWRLIYNNAPKRHFTEQFGRFNGPELGTQAWMDEYVVMNGATPTPTFARALAAVLLFRDFQDKPWPGHFNRTKLYSNVEVYVNGTALVEASSA